MRIFELITPTTKTVQKAEPFDQEKMAQQADRQSDKVRDRLPGYGMYAKGTKDTKDPFMYKKTHILPSNLENDAYYNYVKAIEPHIGENPYFPRVYVTTLTRDANGQVIPSYKMEKLQDGSVNVSNMIGASTAREVLAALVDKMFTDTSFQAFNWDYIAKYLEGIIEHENYDLVSDPQLVQALKLIKQVKDSNKHFSYDIRGDNVMLRIGPTGPHLVFTDPLQDSGKSLAK